MSTWRAEVHDLSALADIADWWDKQEAVRRTPFLHSRVLSLSGLSAKPGERFLLQLLKRDGDVVAGLPLTAEGWRYRTPVRKYAWPFDLVVDPQGEVLDYLPQWLSRLCMVYLYRLPSDSRTLGCLDGRMRWAIQATLLSPYVDLTDLGGEEPVPVSKNLRKSLRRRRRRLEEMGTVTFVDHPPTADVQTVLDRGLDLEATGWKGAEGAAIRSQPQYERWIRALVDVAEDAGWARLSALYLDDQMVAFTLDLEYEQRRFSIMSAYSHDERVARHSPGSLLLHEVLRHASAAGVESYELGYGSQPWKYEWTDKHHELVDVVTYGSTWRGRMLAMAHDLRRRGRKQVPQTANSTDSSS